METLQKYQNSFEEWEYHSFPDLNGVAYSKRYINKLVVVNMFVIQNKKGTILLLKNYVMLKKYDGPYLWPDKYLEPRSYFVPFG